MSIMKNSLVVRASASRAVGCGFESRPGHTKDFLKMVLVVLLLGAQYLEERTRYCQCCLTDINERLGSCVG